MIARLKILWFTVCDCIFALLVAMVGVLIDWGSGPSLFDRFVLSLALWLCWKFNAAKVDSAMGGGG